ncbi:hypothetical protein EsDP_00006050 [Epichloe bromicola]|uniref:L-tryptophan decarboxylase PsiD-like domain-containing protein n=1 Tax=Epichloe bromicola TaxID=79588 RepID=A0ABQ0CWY9_9HYPO
MVHQHRIRKPGAWLPADHRVHREYLSRVTHHVDSHAAEELTPALREFRQLIEGNARIYMYFVQMFDEMPRKHPYWRDPAGTRQVRDYEHMLRVLNHIVTRASWASRCVPFSTTPWLRRGNVPVPSEVCCCSDPEFRRGALKKVLNEWGKYLQTPESAAVLGDHAGGWFGEAGMKDMLQVANAPYKSSMRFDDMFVCDPSAKHMGFASWDGK